MDVKNGCGCEVEDEHLRVLHCISHHMRCLASSTSSRAIMNTCYKDLNEFCTAEAHSVHVGLFLYCFH